MILMQSCIYLQHNNVQYHYVATEVWPRLKPHGYYNVQVEKHRIKEQQNKQNNKAGTLQFEGLQLMFLGQFWIRKGMKDLFELYFSCW